MIIEDLLVFISSFSFLCYGINSLYSRRMISEYKRWGYSQQRHLISYLQILASLGLFAGLYFPILLTIVSFLLFLMMSVAIITRIRIKDSILKTLPSVLYAVLNFFIFYFSLNL